jgi:phosphomethylpyrimidine synthase
MTQLKMARSGKITPQMEFVARAENVSAKKIKDGIKRGIIVIPSNKVRWEKIQANKNIPSKFICGIGEGLKTKVNANIGTSSDYQNVNEEIAKLKIAEEAGADAVMDLSTGGNITGIRQRLLNEAKIVFGTVPIYEAVLNCTDRQKAINNISSDLIFKVIEQQAKDGVDFMTIHSGVTLKVLKHLEKHPRTGGVVSRGGTILLEWMRRTKRENPLYTQFDRILEIAREYDITLSLGDGLRPGALADSFDKLQVMELETLGELAQRAKRADVQVMIEGPGHVPLNQIKKQIELEKKLCHRAPFYVLGPLVTDIAPGYDHITSAIGGALAAWHGADFICYVTPMEHLGLPSRDDVHAGVIASRIAGHAADIAKGVKGAWELDKKFSGYRRNRDWKNQIKYAIDPKIAAQYRKGRPAKKEKVCSMCGDLCVYALMDGE